MDELGVPPWLKTPPYTHVLMACKNGYDMLGLPVTIRGDDFGYIWLDVVWSGYYFGFECFSNGGQPDDWMIPFWQE
jgi:hypothetical protein